MNYPPDDYPEDYHKACEAEAERRKVRVSMRSNNFMSTKKGRPPLKKKVLRKRIATSVSPETDKWLRVQGKKEMGIGRVIDRLVTEEQERDD